MRTHLLTIVTLLGFLTAAPATLLAEDVVVTVTGLKNNKGNIRVHIFTGAEQFEEKDAYKKLNFSKAKMQNGKLTLRISLPAGEYGISLLDDENKNNEMDYNLIRMPKEGFGFSDYYHSSLSKPSYDSFKFQLKKDSTKNVTIKLRYL